MDAETTGAAYWSLVVISLLLRLASEFRRDGQVFQIPIHGINSVNHLTFRQLNGLYGTVRIRYARRALKVSFHFDRAQFRPSGRWPTGQQFVTTLTRILQPRKIL